MVDNSPSFATIWFAYPICILVTPRTSFLKAINVNCTAPYNTRTHPAHHAIKDLFGERCDLDECLKVRLNIFAHGFSVFLVLRYSVDARCVKICNTVLTALCSVGSESSCMSHHVAVCVYVYCVHVYVCVIKVPLSLQF